MKSQLRNIALYIGWTSVIASVFLPSFNELGGLLEPIYLPFQICLVITATIAGVIGLIKSKSGGARGYAVALLVVAFFDGALLLVASQLDFSNLR